MSWTPSRRTLIAVVAAGLLLYAALSVAVAFGLFDPADLRVHVWTVHNVGPTFLGLHWMVWTAVGAATVSGAAVATAAFLAWRAGALGTAVIIVAFALAGGLLVEGLKGMHERPYPQHSPYFVDVDGACLEHGRCDVRLDENATVYCPPGSRCHFYAGLNASSERFAETNATALDVDYSSFPTRTGRAYPSGHTMGATLSWGLALLLGTRAMQGRRSLDGWALAAWLGIALMGGISRIPLYTHWWTDVVASWMLGTALLAMAWLADDWFRPVSLDGPDATPSSLSRARL